MTISILGAQDVDVPFIPPRGLLRMIEQNLVNLTPWHILPRDLARKRLEGLRQRYSTKYIPFAFRQDNDDLAAILPNDGQRIVVIHDYASEGTEIVADHPSFWDWFRTAVDDMIEFE